jgi:hypothetical protein
MIGAVKVILAGVFDCASLFKIAANKNTYVTGAIFFIFSFTYVWLQFKTRQR